MTDTIRRLNDSDISTALGLPPTLRAGLFSDLAGKSIPGGTDLIRTGGHTQAGIGIADYIAVEDTGQGETPYRKRSADGRLWEMVYDGFVTAASLGIVGAEADAITGPDEGDLINSAMAFAAEKRWNLVFDGSRSYWTSESLVLIKNLHIYGGMASFRPLPEMTDPLITMAEGHASNVVLRDLALNGQATPNQMCIYLDARKAMVNPTDGGLWYSVFDRVTINNFDGHAFWLRGGNKRYLGGAGYDYLTPHQFLTFRDCRFERPVGNVNGHALIITGQADQIYFEGHCRFDGRILDKSTYANYVGLNVYMGREYTGGTIPGSPYGGGAPVVVDDIATSLMEFRATSQQADIACWFDRGTYTVRNGWFEDNKSAFRIGTSSTVKLWDNHCPNSGMDGAGGSAVAILMTSSKLGGGRNYASGYDKLALKYPGAVPSAVDFAGLFIPLSSDGASKTSGVMTTDISVTAGGVLTTAGAKQAYIYNSTTPITTITSYLNVGEKLTLFCGSGSSAVIFGTGTNFKVPNNRVVLRPGDSICFERFDLGGNLVCTAISRTMQSAAMPSSGYYEAGEFVAYAGIGSANPTAPIRSGWLRLTTGSNHVLGTDWRYVQDRSGYGRVKNVGTSATTILDVNETTTASAGDRRDIVVNGTDDSDGGRCFSDRLVVMGGSVNVIASLSFEKAVATISPAARSYTLSGGLLQLAMASGTYSVRASSENLQAGASFTSDF